MGSPYWDGMFQQLLSNFGQSMEVTVSVSSLLCIEVHAYRRDESGIHGELLFSSVLRGPGETICRGPSLSRNKQRMPESAPLKGPI